MGGTCDPRFAALREAFAANFTERGEPGGAIALMVDGRLVCDLWGGYRDAARTREWTRETLVNFFSVGKAFTALVALRLVERGLLDLDAPAHCLWPEFGCNGKETITLRHMLSHRAGLPAIREDLPDGAMLGWSRMAEALARQAPWWEPGTQHGYHALTFGHLVGELIRRISGQSVGEYFREHVAGPLDADFHIGVGPEFDSRISDLHGRFGSSKSGDQTTELPEAIRKFMRDMADPNTMVGAAFNNPPVSDVSVNSRAWRQAEIPAANGHGTARSLARIYGALARGGEVDGVRILRPETIERAITPQAEGPDAVLGGLPMRFGLGFMLRSMVMPLSPSPRSFGHPGAGGSIGMADPDTGVGFGYTMNKMQQGLVGGAGGFAMLGAFFESL